MGAATRVGASRHFDPLRQRVDALVGCQGETNQDRLAFALQRAVYGRPITLEAIRN